jgi:hypothetical protein
MYKKTLYCLIDIFHSFFPLKDEKNLKRKRSIYWVHKFILNGIIINLLFEVTIVTPFYLNNIRHLGGPWDNN